MLLQQQKHTNNMNTKLAQFTQYLKDQNKNYFDIKEEQNALIYRTGGDNAQSIPVNVVLREESSIAKLYIFGVCKFHAEKAVSLYKAVNEINAKHIGVCFFVDDSDQTVTVCNAIHIDHAGWEKELFEEIWSLSNCADKQYPKLMKTIWSE